MLDIEVRITIQDALADYDSRGRNLADIAIAAESVSLGALDDIVRSAQAKAVAAAKA